MCKTHGTISEHKRPFSFAPLNERGSEAETARMQYAFDCLVEQAKNAIHGQKWPTCDNGKEVQADIVQDEAGHCLRIEFVCCWPVCPQVQLLLYGNNVQASEKDRHGVYEAVADLLNSKIQRVIDYSKITLDDDCDDNGMPVFVAHRQRNQCYQITPVHGTTDKWKLEQLVPGGDGVLDVSAEQIGDHAGIQAILGRLAGCMANDAMSEETLHLCDTAEEVDDMAQSEKEYGEDF